MMQQVEIYGSPQLVGASTLIGRQMTCRSGEPFVRLWWLGSVRHGLSNPQPGPAQAHGLKAQPGPNPFK